MNTVRFFLPPLIFAAVLLGGPLRAATPGELDLLLARDEATVLTSSGRTYRGTLDGYRDGRLHLRRATDGGEVGNSFAPSEIASLTLPGGELELDGLELLERGRAPEAMPLLEAVARHRLRYLPILTPQQQAVLWRLLRAGDPSGDPHVILAIVRALAAFAATDEARAELLEAELLVTLRLQQHGEARALARRWCAFADPAGGSALGWRVLAEAAYAKGDYEQARWIALQPVTFSSYLPMDGLDRCYVLAIASADRLGDVKTALALKREMKARAIAWPLDPASEELGAHYDSAGDETSAGLRAFSPSILMPAAPARPASLEDTRRLVAPPPTPQH